MAEIVTAATNRQDFGTNLFGDTCAMMQCIYMAQFSQADYCQSLPQKGSLDCPYQGIKQFWIEWVVAKIGILWNDVITYIIMTPYPILYTSMYFTDRPKLASRSLIRQDFNVLIKQQAPSATYGNTICTGQAWPIPCPKDPQDKKQSFPLTPQTFSKRPTHVRSAWKHSQPLTGPDKWHPHPQTNEIL